MVGGEEKSRIVAPGLLEALSGLSDLSHAQHHHQHNQVKVASAVKLIPLTLRAQTEKDWKYVLNRLVRGTAASRASSREGFFAALATLLAEKHDISIALILETLNKQLPLGNQSKSETGETCTGHVLTCGAVIRSGLFGRSTPDDCQLILKCMYNAAAKKSYLGLAAHVFVADYISKCDEENFKDQVWPYLQTEVLKPLNEQTLDSLYCLLTASLYFPSVCKKSVKKIMGQPTLLTDEAAPLICEKLMAVPEFAFINHPIYNIFGKQIASSDCLLKYWNLIESNVNLRNPNRMLVALTILAAILTNIGENVKSVPELLSNKFLTCVLEWFKGFKSANSNGKFRKNKRKNKQDLEGEQNKQIIMKAKTVFDILVDSIKGANVDNEIKIVVLKKLLINPGDIMFSDITNTKCIKTIVDDLAADSVKEFSTILKHIICNSSKKITEKDGERLWTNTERIKAAEIFSQLVCHKTVADNIKWRIKNMQFLLQIGVFRSSGENDEVMFGAELSAAVKKSFFRCLDTKLSKLETLLKVLTTLVEFVDAKMNSLRKHEGFKRLFSDAHIESWDIVKYLTDKLSQFGNKTNKQITVFQVLTMQCGLFLFSDTFTVEMTKSSLKEIKSCYERSVEEQKISSKVEKSVTEGEIIEEEPEWVEVLIDMFLSFLSRDSHLLRSVVQCAFKLLCDNLTPSAIEQLLSVLDPNSDVNPLSIHGEDSDDEDNEEDEDDESKENNSENEEKESSESEDEDEENITINDQFKMAVQSALGNAAPETDTESVDVDEIDEEEGNKLDAALSSAFKMMKNNKKKTLSKKEKKNKKLLTDFRIRVLDLIDIYLEKEPSLELCLGMLSPLFSSLEFSVKDNDQVQLEARIRKTLKNLTAIKSFSSYDGVTVDVLLHHLQIILEKRDRTQFVFKVLGDAISKCTCFIIKCLIKIENSVNIKKRKKLRLPIVELLKECLNSFFSKRDCLLPVILFYNLLQLSWEGNYELLSLIIERTFENSLRPFRRNEGIEMLNIFYRNLKRGQNVEQMTQLSENLTKLENSLSENVVRKLNEDNPSKTFHVKSFSHLLNLLVAIKNYSQIKSDAQCGFDWDQVTNAVQNYRSIVILKNPQEYIKFCKKFDLAKKSNPTIDKNENNDSGHDSDMQSESDAEQKAENDKKKKAKQRGKSDREVTKKQAKMLRAQASSEGLGSVSFSGILNTDVDMDNVEMPSDDDVKVSGEKRKSSSQDVKKKKMKKS